MPLPDLRFCVSARVSIYLSSKPSRTSSKVVWSIEGAFHFATDSKASWRRRSSPSLELFTSYTRILLVAATNAWHGQICGLASSRSRLHRDAIDRSDLQSSCHHLAGMRACMERADRELSFCHPGPRSSRSEDLPATFMRIHEVSRAVSGVGVASRR